MKTSFSSVFVGAAILVSMALLSGIAVHHGATRPAPRPKDAAAAPPVVFEALCRALQDNYPMLEYAGWEDAWVKEFRGRVAAAPTRQAAFEAMDELVCRLNDYHTNFDWTGRPRRVSAPFRVLPVHIGDGLAEHRIWGRLRPPHQMPACDDVAFAVMAAADGCDARPGDVIVAVDGLPVLTALARTWGHAGGSSFAGKFTDAAYEMLRGPPGSVLQLQVRRAARGADELVTLEIPRTKPPPRPPLISAREFEGVPIIRITGMANSVVAPFDAFLEQWRDRPALIIDVRGNGGGSDEVASQMIGRFITKPVISSISFHRRVPTLNFERTIAYTAPRGPWRYEGRVAVVTDEGTMSAAEHFVAGMLEAGALLCGTPTSGACGWIRHVPLPGGATVHVSRTFPLHSGGIPSPMIGMAPHLWRPPTLADVRRNRDTALAAAIDWLRSGAPLPLRMQPLAPFYPPVQGEDDRRTAQRWP